MDIEETRKHIIEYACNDTECGWVEGNSRDGDVYTFPKRALLHKMYGQMNGVKHRLPPYKPFSTGGMKMYNDCPYHTDIILGAGVDIDSGYDDDVMACMFNAIDKVKEEFKHIISTDFIVLSNTLPKSKTFFKVRMYDTEEVKGTWNNTSIYCQERKEDHFEYGSLFGIAIPNAGVEYDLAARKADVIITEVGGKLCHMNTVAREEGNKLVIRVDKAVERFPKFCSVWINLRDNTIEYEGS